MTEKQAESLPFPSWLQVFTQKEREYNSLSSPYSCETLSHLPSAFCTSVSPSFGLKACEKNWWNAAKHQNESAKIGKFSHVAKSYLLAFLPTFSQDNMTKFCSFKFPKDARLCVFAFAQEHLVFSPFYQISFICLKEQKYYQVMRALMTWHNRRRHSQGEQLTPMGWGSALTSCLHGFWVLGMIMECTLCNVTHSSSSQSLGSCLVWPFLCLLQKAGETCKLDDVLILLLLNACNCECKWHFLYTNRKRTKFTG